MILEDYIIAGDTEKYKGCLVTICGTLRNANMVLERMLNNPTQFDLILADGYSNLRVELVQEKDAWWHENLD